MTNYAKLYAQVLGVVLLVVGILGFVPALGGSTGPTSDLLGVFAINPLHNVIHILTGVLGIAAGFFMGGAYSRLYALVFGVVYTLVTVLGFLVTIAASGGTGTLLLIPVNMADNVLHLAIAAFGLAAYFLTSPRTEARVA